MGEHAGGAPLAAGETSGTRATKLLGGRYELRRRLGEGGMGVVYEALDTVNRTSVALKTLNRVDATAIYRLKGEFRSLADVVHPNLVRLFELQADGERWFFTMGLVEGRSFFEHVREDRSVEFEATLLAPALREAGKVGGSTPPPAAGRFDEARLRECLSQLATGVDAIHRARKLHRDLKPSNVLVTPAGRVVILDFGLVSEAHERDDAPRTLVEEGISGTPGFMAPEQCRAERATEASDWYAVGVILYQTLTGRLPFEGTTMQVLLAKQTSDAPSPSTLVADLPEDLVRLCEELLRREPRERPTGAEILSRLGAFVPSADRQAATDAAPFVGRAEELAALDECLRSTRDGQPLIALLTGPSGIGKSSILERFQKTLRGTGAVVLAGRCYEREAVPYKAFDGVIDSLTRYLRRLPPVESAALMPRNIHALCRLFPVLRRVDVVASVPQRGSVSSDPQELRRLGFAALRELFSRISDRNPLVVAIDDLHWGDRDSFHLLEALLTGTDPPPLLVVATCRVDEDERGPLLSELLDQRRGVQGMTTLRIAIEPLSAAEVEAVIEHSAPAADASIIHAESRGNPLIVAELLRHVAHGGDEAPVVSFDDVLRRRLANASAPARRLLEVLSVVARPMERSIAGAACELEGPSLVQAVDELQLAALVRSVAGGGEGGRAARIAVYHDRIRDVVASMLDEDARRTCHARIASALEASAEADPETLSFHALAANDHTRASKYALEASRRARQGLAFERAAALLRVAIDHGDPSPDERLALLCDLAETLVLAERDAEAGRVFLEASRAGASAERAPILQHCRRRAAEQLVLAGDLEGGVQTLSEVLADIGVALPRSPARSILAFLWDRFVLRLRGLSWTPRADSEVDSRELARIDAYNVVAASLALVQPIFGLQFQARLMLLALRAGIPRHIVVAMGMYGLTLALSGMRGFRVGKRFLHEARMTAESVPGEERRRYVAMANGTDGIANLTVGNFVEAREKLRTCLDSLEALPVAVTAENLARSNMKLLYLGSLHSLGELVELTRGVDALLRDAKRRGDQHLEASATRMLNCVWLVRDQPEDATRALEEVRWAPLHAGFDLQRVYELRARGEIDLYTHAHEGSLAEKYRADFAAFDRSLIRTVEIERLLVASLRGRLFVRDAERTGSREALRNAWRTAQVLLRATPAYARARGALIAAAVERQRGDDVQCVHWLRNAARYAEEASVAEQLSAARLRLGEILGGREGAELRALGDEWMRRNAVVKPERLLQVTAPGFARAATTTP